MNIIELIGVSKYYTKSQSPPRRLAAAVRGGEKSADGFCALDNISFSVGRGECVGIIGRNGSGKSTLLRLLSGMTSADRGEIKMRGGVSAMLEPGIGFNPEYSGTENIYLSGALGGRGKREAEEGAAGVMEFAEIPPEFRDMPVKTYSAGMLMRLGFSVMLSDDSDIILVDEALGVGDIRFRAKCYRRFEELKERGRTILFVSHDPDAVRRFCTRAIWLDKGRIRADGGVAEVTSAYMEFCVQPEGSGNAGGGDFVNRYGSAPGSIRSVSVTSAAELSGAELGGAELGGACEITVAAELPEGADLKTAGIAVSIKDRYGLDLCVFRTDRPLKAGRNEITFGFRNMLAPGEYSVSAGLEDRGTDPVSYYEYIEGAAEFKSLNPSGKEIFGLVSLPAEIEYK